MTPEIQRKSLPYKSHLELQLHKVKLPHLHCTKLMAVVGLVTINWSITQS